jgi:hypothetical protein
MSRRGWVLFGLLVAAVPVIGVGVARLAGDRERNNVF